MLLDNLIKKKGSNNKELVRLLKKHEEIIFIEAERCFIADDILLEALKQDFNIIVIPFASVATEYDDKKYNGTCMVTEGKNVYSACYKKAYQGLQEHILIDFDTLKFAYSV